MFTGIDMPPGAQAVYLTLLDRQSATVPEITAAVGHDPATMLDWLRGHRLVVRTNVTDSTDEIQWAAADPAQALRALVRAREDELHGLRGALPDLRERFLRARRDRGPDTVVEHLSGWPDIANRYHELLRGAQREVRLWDHAPYVSGPPAPAEQSVLDRGVRFRILCDPVDLPPDYAQDRGVQIRVHPDLPFRGVIVDGTDAVITLDRDTQNQNGLLVRASPLLDALRLLYDVSWSRAVPATVGVDALTEAEHQVLTLMAAGLKDEAMARQLNVTTRTIRRRAQAVLTALNARSRFEAGVEAARRGLV